MDQNSGGSRPGGKIVVIALQKLGCDTAALPCVACPGNLAALKPPMDRNYLKEYAWINHVLTVNFTFWGSHCIFITQAVKFSFSLASSWYSHLHLISWIATLFWQHRYQYETSQPPSFCQSWCSDLLALTWRFSFSHTITLWITRLRYVIYACAKHKPCVNSQGHPLFY